MSVKNAQNNETRGQLRNEDAITREPGSHPVGTGVGAALGGAAAGAAAGLVGGPLGTVAGAVIGGVAGGFAGKAVAESYDPTIEDAYWRGKYFDRPYYNDSFDYDHYRPAYQSGWQSFDVRANESWATREVIARQNWENEGGTEYMSWEQARPAAKDAYDRLHNQRSSKSR